MVSRWYNRYLQIVAGLEAACTLVWAALCLVLCLGLG